MRGQVVGLFVLCFFGGEVEGESERDEYLHEEYHKYGTKIWYR